MSRTYSYDPGKIPENGLDKMRFELGDVMVEGGADTAALTDEEIQGAFTLYPPDEQWKRAKLALVESLCRRFAYEVDTKTSKLSLSMGQRAKRWQEMYETLKEEVENEDVSIPISVNENQGRKAYFYTGMMQNYDGGGTEQT